MDQINPSVTDTQLIEKYKELTRSADALAEEIKRRNLGWRYLVDNGLKFQAIMAYHTEKNISISEAKKFIESYLIDSIVKYVVENRVDLNSLLKSQ